MLLDAARVGNPLRTDDTVVTKLPRKAGIRKGMFPVLAHLAAKCSLLQQRHRRNSCRRRPVRTPKQRLPLGGHLPTRNGCNCCCRCLMQNATGATQVLFKPLHAREHLQAMAALRHSINRVTGILKTIRHGGPRGLAMLASAMGFHEAHIREVLPADITSNRITRIRRNECPGQPIADSRAIVDQSQPFTQQCKLSATITGSAPHHTLVQHPTESLKR